MSGNMHRLLRSIGLLHNINKFDTYLSISLLLLFSGSLFLGPSRRSYCIFFYILSFYSLLRYVLRKHIFKFNTLNTAAFLYAIIITIYHVILSQYIEGIKTLIYSFIVCISLPQLLLYLKTFRISNLISLIATFSICTTLFVYLQKDALDYRLGWFFYFVHPIQTSVLCQFGLVTLLYSLYLFGHERRKYWMLLISLYFVLLAVLLTYSRSAYLSTGACLIIGMIIFRKRFLWSLLIIICTSLLSISVIDSIRKLPDAELRNLNNKNSFHIEHAPDKKMYIKRASSELAASSLYNGLFDRKSAGRVSYWKKLFSRMDSLNFLYGKGITASHDIGAFTSPHSVYIYHLYHMGIVGFFSLLSVQLICIRFAIRQWKERRINLITILLWPISMISFFFNGNEIMGSPDPYNVLFWVPIILTLTIHYEYKDTSFDELISMKK
jgi:hypothetical protein